MEKQIGLFNRVTGHTYDTIYDLLFTTERVIALIVQHPLDMSPSFSVAGLFLGGRLGMRNERSERIKIADERRQLYEEKGLDELADYHRFNFQMPYREISSVKIVRGLFKARLIFHIPGPSKENRAFRFSIPKRRIPEALELLEKALPNKIKIDH